MQRSQRTLRGTNVFSATSAPLRTLRELFNGLAGSLRPRRKLSRRHGHHGWIHDSAPLINDRTRHARGAEPATAYLGGVGWWFVLRRDR
jgi:hypothetical protein